MTLNLESTSRRPDADIDQKVHLHGVTWNDYQVLLKARGESSSVRIAYNGRTVELMSPSDPHERIKTMIARLLEAWALATDFPLNGIGSWTLKSKLLKVGIEPDECYILGNRRARVPDLAIEVAWTHGGLDKLAIYQALQVREVWVWEAGRITVHRLGKNGYARRERSALLPQLDLAHLAGFLDRDDQTAAVRAYLRSLRLDVDLS